MTRKIVIYTTPWCADCRAAKQFLASRSLPYEEVDIERSPEAASLVMERNDGMRKVPMLDIEGAIVSGDRFDPRRFEKDLCEAGAL